MHPAFFKKHLTNLLNTYNLSQVKITDNKTKQSILTAADTLLFQFKLARVISYVYLKIVFSFGLDTGLAYHLRGTTDL